MRRATVVFLVLCSSFLVSCATLSPPSEDNSQELAADTLEQQNELERQPIPDDAQLGVVERSIIIVDDAQRVASERFGNFMGQVDGFFSNAGSDDNAVSNDSWARIRVDAVRADGNDFKLDTSVKLRAVLPRTERKLKLLISTEDDDSAEAGEIQNSSSQGDQNASLALRFIRTARENTDVNIDVGVRQRSGEVQTFVRLNTRYKLELNRKWKANFANSYQHYSKSGFENTLSFDFRRLFYGRDNLYFRTYTQFDWRKGRRGASIGHTTGVYWLLAADKALALEGLAGYNTALTTGVTDRFSGHEFRIRWRNKLGRPWLFYEVWPSVAWPSSTRYKRTYGILLRLEFIIGRRD